MANKWVKLDETTFCMKDCEDYFRNIEVDHQKCLFMTTTTPNKAGYKSHSKLWHYNRCYYCLTHETTNAEGWVLTRRFLIKSYLDLVHIYDYMCDAKPIPTWEDFAYFVKSCTSVRF